MTILEFLLAALAAVPALSRRGRDNITLTMRNIGQDSLDSVMVFTTGRSYALGPLSAGTAKKLLIGASGDSHIEIEHGETSRRRLRVGTYFESGDRGNIEVRLTGNSVVAVLDSICV